MQHLPVKCILELFLKMDVCLILIDIKQLKMNIIVIVAKGAIMFCFSFCILNQNKHSMLNIE